MGNPGKPQEETIDLVEFNVKSSEKRDLLSLDWGYCDLFNFHVQFYTSGICEAVSQP